jgi:UDP-glucose 4-epimerase
MATSLVTGGAGFIGSHLVEALVNRGDSVRILDDFSTGKWENLISVARQVDIIEGDVRDEATVRRSVIGVDFVFHQAAIAAVPRSMKDPIETHAINATGTLNVLVAARDANVRRLLFASTCAVYGDNPILPKREEMCPEPKSPYAVSKLTGEGYCRVFNEAFGLETIVLRYFNVFGPRQDPTSPYSNVISIFIDKMMHGDPPTIFGDGQQTRDFVYVSDVVRANLLAVEAPVSARRIFNIGRGKVINLLELAEILTKIMGTDFLPRHAPPRSGGEIMHSCSDPSLAQQAFGWRAETGIEAGLHHMVAAMRAARGER